MKLFDVIFEILSKIPAINLNFSGVESAISYVKPVVSGICYMLPLGAIKGILAISLALFGLRLVVAVLKNIWAVLPIV